MDRQYLKRLRRKHWVVIGAVIVTTVAIIALLLARHMLLPATENANSDTIVRSDACKSDHIKRFAVAGSTQDIAAMTALRTEIESLDTYRGSANCQYILLRHSLATGNADEAETTLKVLRQLAPSIDQLSSDFGDQLVSYASLEDSIEAIRANREANVEAESRFWGDGS